MPRTSRNIVLVLLVLLGYCNYALGRPAPPRQATITISATGTPVSSPGSITFAFSDTNGKLYSETVVYGPNSTPASIASALGALFTHDYVCVSPGNCRNGLGAQPVIPGSPTVTFQLNNIPAGFGSLTITPPSNPFFLFNPSGFSNASTVSLSSSANPSIFGQTIVFSAVVTGTGPTPTGSVTFLDGSSVIGSGAVTLNGSGAATQSTSTLIVGTHNITAQYGGDASYSSSTGALTQTVESAGGGGGSLNLTQLYPNSGAQGEFPVSILGSGFGTMAGVVNFGGQAVVPLTWSDTKITFRVPPNAVTSMVSVQVGGTSSSGLLFTVGSVTSCPVQ